MPCGTTDHANDRGREDHPCDKDKDPIVRGEIAAALGGIGPGAKAAVRPLIGLLKDADDGVRGQSAESLGKVGADPKLAVPALAAALADKYPGVRGDAAHALSKFKDDAKPALPALTRLLKDPDHAVRVYAADAVYELTDDPRLVMPVLLDGLKNEDPFVRGDAAHTTEGIQAFRTMRSRHDREDTVAEATLTAWERFLQAITESVAIDPADLARRAVDSVLRRLNHQRLLAA